MSAAASERDWPLPWPLAWHPRVESPDDRPDTDRFTVPRCGGAQGRIQGGLWTSPTLPADDTLAPQLSLWSIFHDREGMSAHEVRRGYLLNWPARERTAVIDSSADLHDLCARYPCTTHLSLEKVLCGYGGNGTEHHDDLQWPPLDFAAMATEFDALYVTDKGLRDTWLVAPGTTSLSVETVLWLRPTWTLTGPFVTRTWPL